MALMPWLSVTNNMKPLLKSCLFSLLTGLSILFIPNAQAEPVLNQDYRLVQPIVTSDPEKIEVIDFFAYTCGHCLRLAPLIDEWEKTLPDDVKLIRVPVAWDQTTEFLSRIYYTLASLNRLDDLHMVFWNDLMQGKISSSADLAGWVKSHGISNDLWQKAYNSFSVTAQTQQATKLWQAYNLDATPYIGVAGKYLTAPHMVGSRQKVLPVVNWLIEKERKDRRQP